MNDFQPNQDICLVPYYPAYEIALPWYQDAELCHHVDNQNRIYDLSILKNMYQYLDSHGAAAGVCRGRVPVVRLAPEQAEAAQGAKKAAEALGIECILLNAEALAQQPGAAGAWPQFAALLTAADKLGIQYIGSSSRARLEVGTDGVHTVLPPVDAARDDSTALAALPQKTLARLLLPLGEFDAGDLAELAQELQL